MKITFVKKILATGEPCPKCRDVEQRLSEGGHWDAIDETLIADERDPDSAGMVIARRLGVNRAPFFVVENGKNTIVYTVFFKFLKEILLTPSTRADEAKDLLAANPDLDFV